MLLRCWQYDSALKRFFSDAFFYIVIWLILKNSSNIICVLYFTCSSLMTLSDCFAQLQTPVANLMTEVMTSLQKRKWMAPMTVIRFLRPQEALWKEKTTSNILEQMKRESNIYIDIYLLEDEMKRKKTKSICYIMFVQIFLETIFSILSSRNEHLRFSERQDFIQINILSWKNVTFSFHL